ncbi:unnamed protein product [Arctia plantaginis]|uniref:TIMELESS-interacting protein n=1 Tax=Arctia plantaginis TaxID=874455 RepID=A0A8S0Z795_ARCPL|nr:unnamed protein product [Arctia plantaginis]
MSLLEDVFLQDEANEAEDLERVIEGDGYDERPRSLSPTDDESDSGKREDKAEEDKRRVDPASTKTKKVIKNPRFVLNPARLTGPRGIQVIPEHFKDFKFKGKGHEKEDLDMVLKKLEHWAYRLYPKFEFQDCLKKIETLGRKRPVMVHLHKIRTDQFLSEETVVQKDSSDDEAQPPQEEDEFDKLLRQQIEIARATPAPDSVKKATKKADQWERVMTTPIPDDRPSLMLPKATSSPSISEEQKERMLRNRKLAEERRLARLKQTTNISHNTTSCTIVEVDEPGSTNTSYIINTSDQVVKTNNKNNRSNVIDSSDSDEGPSTLNASIVVDVHHNTNVDEDKSGDKLVYVDMTSHNDSEEMIIDDQSIKNSDKNDDVDVSKSNNKHSNALDITEMSHKQSDHNNSVITEENSDDGDKELRLSNNDFEKDSDTVIAEVNDNQIKEIQGTIENDTNPSNKSISNDNIDEAKNELNDCSSRNFTVDENVKQKDPADGVTEIMDVDFSDDF